MSYYIDFKSIPIKEFKEKLETSEMLPSRRILQEKASEIFPVFEKMGIEEVQQLYDHMRTKPRMKEFVAQAGIDQDYLVVLLRELNSYRPKPSVLSDFRQIPDEVIEGLLIEKIKNTRDLYLHVLDDQSRKNLAEQTNIDLHWIERLTSLTDLCRVKWVNHTFADVLFALGHDQLRKLQVADPKELHEQINELNRVERYYNAHIGLHDVELCVQAANEITSDITW